MDLSPAFRDALNVIQAPINERLNAHDGSILWLTGAGISAESGIPTFRGPEGYWQVGSVNYRPEDLATRRAFQQMPADVWSWYLYRRAVCNGAEPNAAHHALREMERRCEEGGYPERFRLITQNVDGLHNRMGHKEVWTIHGHIDLMRAVGGTALVPVPAAFDGWEKGRQLTADEVTLLQIDGVPTRPHVLWFDETYNEHHYRFESSLKAAAEAALLVIVGSQGATNLPSHIAQLSRAQGAPVILIDPIEGQCDRVLDSDAWHLRGPAGTLVPALVARLLSMLDGSA